VARRPELQFADVNALLRVVEGIEDGHLLLAKTREAPGATVYDRTEEERRVRDVQLLS
jgi:hypothetical protein